MPFKILRTCHLLYAGTTIFYSVLVQLRIRLECQNSDMEDIVHISGRGSFETPESCTLKSSKAIFPLPIPSKVFFVANNTMGSEATIFQGQEEESSFFSEIETKRETVPTRD